MPTFRNTLSFHLHVRVDMKYTDAGESLRGKHTTHILCSVIFFFDNRAVYAIMWNNFLEPDRSQMTMPYGACWIPKATNTQSEYVIVIVFPRQQYLRQRVRLLRCTYNAGRVLNSSSG
jgi:hypothetical protein